MNLSDESDIIEMFGLADRHVTSRGFAGSWRGSLENRRGIELCSPEYLVHRHIFEIS